MAARERHPMPEDVRDLPASRGLRAAYDARPPYQRNDYLGWISRAKGEDTRAKRMAQMAEELSEGGVYMGMKHAPSAKG